MPETFLASLAARNGYVIQSGQWDIRGLLVGGLWEILFEHLFLWEKKGGSLPSFLPVIVVYKNMMFGAEAAILQLEGNKSEDEKPVCIGCCWDKMDKAGA